MGSGSSCLTRAVSLNTDDEEGDSAIAKLSGQPSLLTRPFSGAGLLLGGMAQTWIHVACERKQVQLVKRMFSFLASSDLATVREALSPYCRRIGLPLPTSVADGVAVAVGCCNVKGQTPLMHACYAGCPELVRFLLAQGADPWAADRCGCRTALHYAAISGCVGSIAALLEAPPTLLVRHGARYINVRSLSGLVPLHYAVFFERHDALRELLRHEPNISAATTCDAYDAWADGEARATPLHFAAARGNDTAALELLRYYAARRHTRALPDPRLARNAGGRRPWQLAATHYPAFRHLTALLHPGTPLALALGEEEALQDARVGPPPLAVLAAAALRQKLLASLEAATATTAAPLVAEEGKDGRRICTSGCAASLPAVVASPIVPAVAAAADLDATSPRFRVAAALRSRAEEEDVRVLRQRGLQDQQQQQQPQQGPLGQSRAGCRSRSRSSDGGGGSSGELGSADSGEVHPFGVQDEGVRADGAAALQAGTNGRACSCCPAGPASCDWGSGICTAGDRTCAEFGSDRDPRYSRASTPSSSGSGLAAVPIARAALPAAAVADGAFVVPSFREGRPSAGGLRPRSPSSAMPVCSGGPPTTSSNAVLRPSSGGSGNGGGGGGVSLSRSAPSGGADEYGSLAGSVRLHGNFTSASLDNTRRTEPRFAIRAGVCASTAVREDDKGVNDEGACDLDDDGACGVCFAHREAVRPASCSHGLCAACAAELCRAVANRPLLCPFCRQPVTGFVRVA